MRRTRFTLLFLSQFVLPFVAAGCGDAPAPAAVSHSAGGGTDRAASPDPSRGEPSDSPDARVPQIPNPKSQIPAESTATDPAAIRDVTFDDIKLELEKGQLFVPATHLTDSAKSVDGKRIRIRGYILPGFQQSGITQFVLVRDNMACCFGPGAALFDCIIVEMQPGKSTEFTVRPVAVEGTFKVQELLDPDGKQLAIYHLDGETVE